MPARAESTGCSTRRRRAARSLRAPRAIAELDAAGLATVMEELAAIGDLAGRAGSYAGLRFAVDTQDPANGALIARVEERATAINNEILFVELEWAALPDERGRAAGRRPARVLPPLPRVRPPVPPAPAERAGGADPHREVAHRSQRGVRLFSELTSAITVDLDGRDRLGDLEEGLSRLQSPDREVRGRRPTPSPPPWPRACAHEPSCSTRCSSTSPSTTACGTTDSWIASRNLANEASDESVEALVDAVQAATTSRSAGTLKARLLGLDRLADYDRMASVADGERSSAGASAGARARRLRAVLARARRRRAPLLRRGWIDARAPGQAAGRALRLHGAVAHPYLLLNWTSRRRDVLTLAHELGHGLHAYLARPGRLPPDHAAHAGRDGVGVRRDRHLRAPARRHRRSRPSGSRCSPSRSRARSPPCSARRR